MSEKEVVYSHELVVRFDQDENGAVKWLVEPDASIANTSHASFEELAKSGAPLAALGIRALAELLSRDLINIALDKANNHLWKEHFRLLSQRLLPDSNDVTEPDTGDSGDPVVIH